MSILDGSGKLVLAGFFLAGAVAAVLLVYLTPLKHLNLIPPSMHEVDPKDFYAELSKQPDRYIFIDVRSPGEYNAAHAKGAINIPINHLYDEHYSLPHSGKEIAVICTGGSLSGVAYGYLQNWGFLNLLHIQGGLQNWSAEGLPVEGARVPSLSTSPASGEHR